MNRQEVLLKEYEVCQQHINTMGTQNWQSVSIFLVFNALVFGFVINMQTHNHGSFVAVSAIGIAVIFIFYLWMLWVQRQEFVQRALYERMHEIEGELGMWKNWYAVILDELKSNEEIDTSILPKEKKEPIKKLRKHYAKAWGYRGLRYMAFIIMASWMFLIFREAILVFEIPEVSQWFLN